MRHEKTVSVSKIRHLWEPWEEDETPRKVNSFSALIHQNLFIYPSPMVYDNCALQQKRCRKPLVRLFSRG